MKDLEEFLDLVKEKGAEIVVLQFWDKEEFELEEAKYENKLI